MIGSLIRIFSFTGKELRETTRRPGILASLVLGPFLVMFILPVEDFVTWMQYVAYALPVTHGIAALQDLMLRGSIREIWMLGVLGGIGVFLYVVSLMRLRRVLHRAD